MFKTIPINELVPHPENPNEMNEESYEKLKSNIKQTGNYEAITVRIKNARYEILNGYHRWCALKELGYNTVNCQIWTVTDQQARLLLATLNRIKGTDDTTKRAKLLAGLKDEFGDELLGLIPESERSLDSLLGSLENSGVFDPETERGLIEEKLMQAGVDTETANRMAGTYQPPATANVLKFVFKDIRQYNKAVEYFGKKGNPDDLISLIENHGKPIGNSK